MRVVKDDGSVFVSMFKDGELHGFCRKIDENGDYHLGQYKNGLSEGTWI